MLREFKDFIDQGSFVYLAVAFVMGLAVASVISTIVDRLMMPLVALAVGQPNFDAIGTFGENGSLGAVITALVDFLLVAFVLFLVVKAYNKTRRSSAEESAAGAEQTALLREIRDSLRGRA